MQTNDGTRCDSCGKVALDAADFYRFVMPPNGHFPGIAKKSTPNVPEQLHACPTCKPKVLNLKNFKDLSVLPRGPLKNILERINSKDRGGRKIWLH